MFRKLVLAVALTTSIAASAYEAAPYTDDASRKLIAAKRYVEDANIQTNNPQKNLANLLASYSALYEKAGFDFPKSFARYLQTVAENNGVPDMRPNARLMMTIHGQVAQLKEGMTTDAAFPGAQYAVVRAAYGAIDAIAAKQKQVAQERRKALAEEEQARMKQAAEENERRRVEDEARNKRAQEARDQETADLKASSERYKQDRDAKFNANMDEFRRKDAAANAELKQRNDGDRPKTSRRAKSTKPPEPAEQTAEQTSDEAKGEDKPADIAAKDGKSADKDPKAADTVKKLIKLFGK
jgi:hypothetical protein